jgi:hypothetical protein
MTAQRPLHPEEIAASMPRDLYRRHLGVPRGTELEGRARALADDALAWYRAHGTPWAHAVIRKILENTGEMIVLEGGTGLTGEAISAGFRAAGVHAVLLVAASAGAKVDGEVDRLWREGRPDEAMFLSALAVAMAEHLRDRVSEIVGEEQARLGLVSLPRYAPGYDGWDLSGQLALVAALEERGPLRVLPSGGLLPQKSTVVAIGLSARTEVSGLEGFWQRRRSDGGASVSTPAPYAFPERALAKWSRERLRVVRAAGGRVLARFRFDGKTCSSMGRAFAIDYEVELERDAAEKLRITAASCVPAAGDTGHELMCAYMADRAKFPQAWNQAPLLGQALDAAISWAPEESPAPCLCVLASQNHKWRIVYQTIHYAASQLGPE